MKYLCAALILLSLLASCTPRVYKSFFSATDAPRDSTIIADTQSPCKKFENYAPDVLHPEHTPLRYIRVRFFIIRHDEHDKQFDLETAIAYIRMMMHDANVRLRSNAPMNLPVGNTTPVLPINYQYYLYPDPNDPADIGIEVIVDSTLAWFNKKVAVNGNYDTKVFEKYGTHKDSVLNIFMLEHHPDSSVSPTYNSGVCGVGFSNWLKLVGYAQSAPQPQLKEGRPYFENHAFTTSLMNHELGHTLGLAHSWSGNDGCDDTPNHPNCWDPGSPACKESGSPQSNNMMDYNNTQLTLTPCQIGKVHYNLSKDNGSMRKFLLPVWCGYKADKTITIAPWETITWGSSRELEGDIIIENGATLVIQCRISLPGGAKVVVKPGGTLRLEGGTITNLCGEKWAGIEVWRKKRNEGKVILSPDAQLLNVKDGL